VTTILVVVLEGMRVGLDVSAVTEVVRAVAVTPLPGTPTIVEGVIDVRGRIVPLLDLAQRFGHAPRSLTLSDRFVLVESRGRTLALHVAEAAEVIEVDDEAMDGLGDFGPHPAGVSGVGKLPDGLVLIQDMEAFLTETEGELLEQALPAGPDTARG
jgi:purine-binding chemotaxis protein CheW